MPPGITTNASDISTNLVKTREKSPVLICLDNKSIHILLEWKLHANANRAVVSMGVRPPRAFIG